MYTEGDLLFNWVEDSAKVDEAWSRVGVTCISNIAYFNEYYKDGKQISRGEALRLLGSFFRYDRPDDFIDMIIS